MMENGFIISVTILWGESSDIDCDYPRDEPVTYKFENNAEKQAFLLGVNEARGWNKGEQS